ncbi:MAG: hypothetical protein QXY39_03500 [Thermofilaceae archaeon]
MALVYGSKLSRRLEELGVMDEVCSLSESIYHSLRALWESYAQNIGRMVMYARSALRMLPDNATDEMRAVAEILEGLVDTEYRQTFFTHPVKNFLEVVYTGGSGSAGGLGLLSYVCGFQSEARFLITRKSIDIKSTAFVSQVSRIVQELRPVYDYAVSYAPDLIRRVVSSISELNEMISHDIARDILGGKELFNMHDVNAHAENALIAIESFAMEYEALSELLDMVS